MPKPIALIRIPTSTATPVGVLTEAIQSIKKELSDYHVLAIRETTAEKLELEVFYDKDFTETDYQQLETLINNYLNK